MSSGCCHGDDDDFSNIQYIITTLAGTGYGGGTGTGGSTGDGGAATSAQLYYPVGVSVDNSGKVYITDTNNNKIRMVNSAGIITTFAGTGTAGSAGDGGAATSAQLNGPNGISVDTSGNLYITDQVNNKIRVVAPQLPTSSPTPVPSRMPTSQPSKQPTKAPSRQPSSQPTQQPINRPTGIN